MFYFVPLGLLTWTYGNKIGFIHQLSSVSVISSLVTWHKTSLIQVFEKLIFIEYPHIDYYISNLMLSYFPRVTNEENMLAIDETRIPFDSNGSSQGSNYYTNVKMIKFKMKTFFFSISLTQVLSWFWQGWSISTQYKGTYQDVR